MFGSVEQINEDNVTLFRPGGWNQGQAADVELPFESVSLLFFRLDRQLEYEQPSVAAKVLYEAVSPWTICSRRRRRRTCLYRPAIESRQLERRRRAHVGGYRHERRPVARSGNEPEITKSPANSTAPAEWFSSGNAPCAPEGTPLGDLLGDRHLLRRCATRYAGPFRNRHEFKLGVSAQHVRERSRIDVYQSGLFIYITDTRALPLCRLRLRRAARPTCGPRRRVLPDMPRTTGRYGPDLRLSLALQYEHQYDTATIPTSNIRWQPDGTPDRLEQPAAARRLLVGCQAAADNT